MNRRTSKILKRANHAIAFRFFKPEVFEELPEASRRPVVLLGDYVGRRRLRDVWDEAPLRPRRRPRSVEGVRPPRLKTRAELRALMKRAVEGVREAGR